MVKLPVYAKIWLTLNPTGDSPWLKSLDTNLTALEGGVCFV